jgi:hypothetical protein
MQVNGIHLAARAFQYHRENQRDKTGAIVRCVDGLAGNILISSLYCLKIPSNNWGIIKGTG